MKTIVNFVLECIHGLSKIIFTGKAIERSVLTICLLLAIGSFAKKEILFFENILLIILFAGYIKFKGGRSR